MFIALAVVCDIHYQPSHICVSKRFDDNAGALYQQAARILKCRQPCVLFIAAVVVFFNLIVDLLYGLLDPRIRYG